MIQLYDYQRYRPKKRRRLHQRPVNWYLVGGGLLTISFLSFSVMMIMMVCAASLLFFSYLETRVGTDAAVVRFRLPTLTPTPFATSGPTTPPTSMAGVAPATTLEPAPIQPNPVLPTPEIATPEAAIAAIGSVAPPQSALPGAAQTEPVLTASNPTPGVEAAPNPAPTVGAVVTALLTATATPTVIPATSTATAIPTETPTSAPTETPTATPLPPGWSFTGVRLNPDYEDGLLLYGMLINNTGSTQALELVKGSFYDGQGQVIAGDENISGYWPVDVVLPGAGVPFELFVDSITNAANFDLGVESETIAETVQQDFEFLEVNQQTHDDDYCLQGKLQNKGGELHDYAVVTAILYDGQDNVINFGDNQELEPQNQTGFEICIAPPNQGVARYELRAWGQ